MIPSFAVAVVPDYILRSPLEVISIMGLVHGIAGVAAVTFGIWLVGAWHFSKDVKGCFTRKRLMRGTITVWITALIFGIALYAVFYGAQLIN
jgi:fructose-specific phosphotransferase system IIC component